MGIFYHIVEDDPLDNGSGSQVIEGQSNCTIQGPDGKPRNQTFLGHRAYCGVCKSTGPIAPGPGTPGDSLRMYDAVICAREAVEGDIVLCKCGRSPKVIATYGRMSFIKADSGSDVICDATELLHQHCRSSWIAPPLNADTNEDLELYFEIVDAITDTPIEGMTHTLSSDGQVLVFDNTLIGGKTRAFSVKDHPNLSFVAWRAGDAR